MTPRGDLDLIKTGLIERIGEVCQKLLPQGRQEGGLWVSHNPVTGDFKPGRAPTLKVRLRGGVVGAWKDWRGGDKGDVLGLVAYVNNTDVPGALVWGRDFLGLRSMSRADRETMRVKAVRRSEVREQEDQRRRAKKLADAQKLFMAAGSLKEIGPALVPHDSYAWAADPAYASPAQKHAEGYFSARKIPLGAVPTLNPFSLRFSRATEWWKGAAYRSEDGRRFKEAPGALYPAIHAGMRNRLGIVTCCHVTFLDPTRPAKAPVDQAKLMYGEALHAAIEMSMGPNNVPFWLDDGQRPQPLVIAEGIETALSFAVAGTPARVWACGSLAGVGAAPIDLACVSWVLFARDNNFQNAQAQKQFEAALEKLEASGKPIVVEASHFGDDFNDLARGEE